MKKPVLILLAIMLILAGSVIANAQNEARAEAKSSWFDSFIGFFKSLFVKIFHTEQIKEGNIARNLSENISEEKVGFNKATENKQETGIANITNITCGYCQYLVNDTCLNYSCCNDNQCNSGEICVEHNCTVLNCSSCQYAENHKCVSYECCKDADCEELKVCENHKCMVNLPPNINYAINFETVQISGEHYLGEYDGPCVRDSSQKGGYNICVSVIANSTEWERMREGIKEYAVPEFYDSEHYILLAIFYGYEEGPAVAINNIIQKNEVVKIYFDVWLGGAEKSSFGTAWDIVKIKRDDLIPKDNLNFLFIGNHSLGSGVSYNITLGEWKVENISV